MTPKHIVIIGAARSGTKILRDSLAAATQSGKVPYDVGYVWRIGNESLPDDLLEPDQISERSRRYIRRFVDRYAQGQPGAVLEKTVGNCMRIPAVASVFPDATYIQLVRDGVDVIESTRRQWTMPSDTKYLLAKLRHFPLRLAPTYGRKFVGSLVHRRVADDGRVGTWGPRYPGIDADLRHDDLLTVCARQWRHAVEDAAVDLARLSLPTIEVRYEHFVEDPTGEMERIVNFTGLHTDPGRVRSAVAHITPERRGTGRANLDADELAKLDAEVGALCETLGYPRPLETPPSIPPSTHPAPRP